MNAKQTPKKDSKQANKTISTPIPIEVDKLSPRQLVTELSKYIIGQEKAKRAVAIAIRNRIRRRRVPEDFREEIYPKNIIMIGPTGCGKTEIARRLSRLMNAPFVKVEATKYTEVGYVGRDVESMIRDLIRTSMNIVQKEHKRRVTKQAEANARERLIDLLLPSTQKSNASEEQDKDDSSESDDLSAIGKRVKINLAETSSGKTTQKIHEFSSSNSSSNKNERALRARQLVAKKLDSGELEERLVGIESQTPVIPMFHVMTDGPGPGPGSGDMDMNLQSMLGDLFSKKQKRRQVKISEARRILTEEELENLVDEEKVREEATQRAEQMGIIFIDEMDKICGRNLSSSGPDISREGVQRDLLPIVEGAVVNTRNGPIKTDHILFIAAGAFHSSSPADLIPELQGRFPIRVELEKLTKDDFRQILTGPRNSLVRQVQELLATEEVTLEFSPDGLDELASFAYEVNESTENIGARRLHTIMEHLLEDISFEAPELPVEKKHIVIDKAFVTKRLSKIVKEKDLSRYIL